MMAACQEDCMARLRHFAVVVKDLDKAAAFYQVVFELKRVGREDLRSARRSHERRRHQSCAPASRARRAKVGLAEGASRGCDHFGFQVDDLAGNAKRIEANGANFLRSRRRSAGN
jgi:predicted enzyme related to lactoylglutathione lyase